MRIAIVLPLAALAFLSASANRVLSAQGNPPQTLKLTVPAYSDGGQIPEKYGCSAKPAGISPALQWTGAPEGTASFAVIFHDLDANPQKGSMDVTHWIIWNLPGSSDHLQENVQGDQQPDGAAQGKNVRGANAYQPPCPPPGGKPHHYVFELYALDKKLDLAPGSTRAELLQAMDGHIIGKSAYVGTFSR